MSVEELDRRLTAAVAAFPAIVRRELIRVLELPDDAGRAEEIGRLYKSGVIPQMAELLIDLEEYPRSRRIVLAELRAREWRDR